MGEAVWTRDIWDRIVRSARALRGDQAKWTSWVQAIDELSKDIDALANKWEGRKPLPYEDGGSPLDWVLFQVKNGDFTAENPEDLQMVLRAEEELRELRKEAKNSDEAYKVKEWTEARSYLHRCGFSRPGFQPPAKLITLIKDCMSFRDGLQGSLEAALERAGFTDDEISDIRGGKIEKVFEARK